MAKHVVVSLSGGMDSSTLLLRCLKEYDTVTALSFDYGQKHNVELERASELIEYLDRNGHPVKYQRITLQGLVSLLNSKTKNPKQPPPLTKRIAMSYEFLLRTPIRSIAQFSSRKTRTSSIT